MVELNDNAIDYMKRLNFKDIVLNIEEISSWCAPPRLEILVDFTNKSQQELTEQGYIFDNSILGKVYYKPEGIEVCGQIHVNYMEYPWLSCFETEGIRMKKR